MSISHKCFVICAQLKLFGQFLLGNVQSLMMETSLVGIRSKIRGQVVLDIDDLGHILHPMSNSLSLTSSNSNLSKSRCKILILRCLALNDIEIELIFVTCTTNASLIGLTVSLLETIHWVLDALVAKVVELSSTTDVHGVGLRSNTGSSFVLGIHLYLIVITPSLGSSLDLVLNLSCLFFVWVSDGDALANLLIVLPIQWVHLMMGVHAPNSMFCGWVVVCSTGGRLCISAYVDDWRIVHSLLSSLSFWWSRPVSTLRLSDSSLPWSQLIGWRASSLPVVSLLLLLEQHLLFYLMFLKLLSWSKIEVVDYVCYVGNAVCILLLTSVSGCSSLIACIMIICCTLCCQSVLNQLSLFQFIITGTLKSFMVTSSIFLLASLILISDVDHLLIFGISRWIDVLWSKLFIIIVLLVLRS